MATSELTEKLQRQNLADGGDISNPYKYQVFNPYTEFPEFTRKEIKHYQKMFKQYERLCFLLSSSCFEAFFEASQ